MPYLRAEATEEWRRSTSGDTQPEEDLARVSILIALVTEHQG
jgi:hypothetical protein